MLAASPTPPAEQPHPDDTAVDRFAEALKAKLAAARAKGRGGWDTPECTQQRLSDMLREHVDKGDPRDVANFCLFLWARGEAIAPPAEQPATPKADATTEAALGGVYAELPAPNLPRGGFPDLFTEGQMRDFADRTHALRMQAAPKAAPGEPQNCERCCGSGEDPAGYYDQSRGDAGATFVGPCRECNGTGAAPQQEAQEPALFVSPKQLAALTDPDDPEGEHGRYLPARKTSKGLFTQPLYTAPQPAPAPLSEREAFEAAWEKLHGKRPVLWSRLFAEHKMETPAHSEGNYFAATEQAAWKLWQARAALAAHGGQ